MSDQRKLLYYSNGQFECALADAVNGNISGEETFPGYFTVYTQHSQYSPDPVTAQDVCRVIFQTLKQCYVGCKSTFVTCNITSDQKEMVKQVEDWFNQTDYAKQQDWILTWSFLDQEIYDPREGPFGATMIHLNRPDNSD